GRPPIRLAVDRHADGLVQRGGFTDRQVADESTLHARELHGPVSYAYQATDNQPDGFEYSPHFAISAFAKRDMQPAVGARPAAWFDRVEMRRPVVEHYAVRQRSKLRFGRRAEQTN